MVGEFAGGELEGGHAELVQQVGALLVEGAREEGDAGLPARRQQCAVRLVVEFQPAQHLELRVLAARGAPLVLGLAGRAGHETLGLERLELHRVGTGLRGFAHESQGEVQGAVVVHAGLGDEEHGRRVAHGRRAAGAPR